MEEFQPPEPNANFQPTADIVLVQDENRIVQTESYPVIPKANVKSDFARPVLMSDILEIEGEAEKLSKGKVQWDEIGIGVATMGFGATLSAITSNVKLDSNIGILFYIVIPIISFSASVFVVMFKIMKSQKTIHSAFQIQQIIKQYIDSGKEK